MKSNSYTILKSDSSVSTSKDLICIPSCWPLSQKVCHLVSFYVILYNFMSFYVILCRFMSFHVILCHFLSTVILCHFMSFYVILCHFMSFYVLLWHSIAFYFIFKNCIMFVISKPKNHFEKRPNVNKLWPRKNIIFGIHLLLKAFQAFWVIKAKGIKNLNVTSELFCHHNEKKILLDLLLLLWTNTDRMIHKRHSKLYITILFIFSCRFLQPNYFFQFEL